MISKNPISWSEKAVTFEDYESWQNSGMTGLPAAFADVAFEKDFTIAVLVYEFDVKQDHIPTFVRMSSASLNTKQHLAGAGLVFGSAK